MHFKLKTENTHDKDCTDEDEWGNNFYRYSLVFLKWEISYKIWKFTHNYFIYVKEQLQFTLILN